jgi:signal transduction histidine kinase
MATDKAERRVQRLIAAGFLTMIGLLLADGFIGVRSILSIQGAVSRLVADQNLQTALIDALQQEQQTLSAIFYRLEGDSGPSERLPALSQINAIEQHMRGLVARTPMTDRDLAAWRGVEEASGAFAAEARRLLSPGRAGPLYSRELLRRHESVVGAIADLIRVSHREARQTQDKIEQITAGQLREDVVLLGACLTVACVCAAFVLRAASRLYERVSEQTEQLNRVSWRLLDGQEMVGRRLSHELHDELGQALTALKTSLARHAEAPCTDADWMKDCSQLLKESIQSVHEISQLLRPTILDDFGLDSALRWLCERFEERTSIDVQYSSSFEGRLIEQTETHLFRIAQEALTNVARHSGASRAEVRLRADQERVYLSIADNGKGLPHGGETRNGAFGLIGMRARAQSSGGTLALHSKPGEGVCITVWVPLEAQTDEQKDPSSAG